MKLIIKKGLGLEMLKPSKTYEKQMPGDNGQGWKKTRTHWPHEEAMPCRILVSSGSHELERIENPFVQGGEPWLVLKGSRIGSAESYLQRVVKETASKGIQLVAA